MLDPRGRQLLLSSLRPPDEFRFDRAVGTTFSLDLIALLTTPLAFAMFDWKSDDGVLAADPTRPKSDPLALLESLRRSSDRIHIFCQAGQIKIPPANQRLLTYLEQSVIEVAPPAARAKPTAVFHPKVWAVRYTGPDEAVRYRLLCLTRNLTFDRSWDTVLLLDGRLTERKNAFAANRPLADFVRGLPSLAVRTEQLSAAARQDTDQIAQELRIVEWELPEGIDELRFWPLGMNGKGGWPFPEKLPQLLVISPFVTDEFLRRFGTDGTRRLLVSRAETLLSLQPATLEGQWRCFTLDDGLIGETSETETPPEAETELLSGLHAKIYVADAGRNAHVWTGSANATTAAFAGNVEFLVELIGKKNLFGVDATIGENGDRQNLRPLLVEFHPAAASAEPAPDQAAAELLLESTRRQLTTLPLAARIAGDEGALTTLLECFEPFDVKEGVAVRCRPVTLPAADAQVVPSGDAIQVRFGPHAPESVTSFMAFSVSAKVGAADLTAQFVVNLPLRGAPADRKERLLRDLLRDSQTLLRFLVLLLADDPEQLFVELRQTATAAEANGPAQSAAALPLLEHLLRTLQRAPERLDQVQRLIDDLRKTPEGRSLVPPEFEAIWEPIRRVRRAGRTADSGMRGEP